jgi:hypothetical protein
MASAIAPENRFKKMRLGTVVPESVAKRPKTSLCDEKYRENPIPVDTPCPAVKKAVLRRTERPPIVEEGEARRTSKLTPE